MDPATLGFCAGIFTTFASLPQIVYVLRTRSMDDVSLATLCLFAVGVSLWLAYGIVLHAPPIIWWNAISLALYAVQIALKLSLTFDRRRQREPVGHIETAR